MIDLILYIVSMVAVVLTILCVFKKIDIIYAVVMAFMAVHVVYGGASILLYRIYKYSITSALAITLGVSVAALILLLILKKRPDCSLSFRKNLVPVIMVSVIGLLSVLVIRSDYFGLEDSMGRIQSKALKMMSATDIYGIVQEDYYYVYSNEDLTVYDNVMAGSEDLLRSANNTLSAEMALAGELIGYHNMIYIFSILIGACAYLMYILMEWIIRRMHMSKLKGIITGYAGSAVILIACVIAVAVPFVGRTGVAWSEMEFITSTLHPQDAIIVDDAIINEVYIPLRFMTQTTVLPQTGEPDQIGQDLMAKNVFGYDKDRNITYITRVYDIQDNPITNGTYDYRTVEAGNYRLYKSAEQYMYEKNQDSDKQIAERIALMSWILVGIIPIIAVLGLWKAVRSKKARFINTLIQAIGLYGMLYTFVAGIYINHAADGGLAYSTVHNASYAAGINVGIIIPSSLAVSTWISIGCAAVIFLVLGHIYETIRPVKATCKVINFTAEADGKSDVSTITDRTPQKLTFKNVFYRIRAIEVVLVLAVLFIGTVVLHLLGHGTEIYRGAIGSAQAGAVSLITENGIRYNPDFYKMIAGGYHSSLAAWFGCAGSLLGIHNMIYGILGIGTVGAGIAMFVVDILSECRVIRRMNGGLARWNIDEVQMLTYAIPVLVISITISYTMSQNTTAYTWSNLENYADGIRMDDKIVVNHALETPLSALLEAYTGSQVYIAGNMELRDGNSVYYITDENEQQAVENCKAVGLEEQKKAFRIQNGSAETSAEESVDGAEQDQEDYYIDQQKQKAIETDIENKRYCLAKKDSNVCIYRIMNQSEKR